ncbi:hydrolase [Plectosphaerella plurivora]|uniref:Hydrolase n=1 Tax=Plectosphaerella plurivora TaxID=936078 RepID=A0A9P8VL12_9PEZI|nr:hydrolase [Plectosphaerella plurivora]
MFAGWKSRLALGMLLSSMAVAFENPIRAPAPDPSLVMADGMYYLTFTSYNRITIVRSDRLNGLIDGEERTVWTDTNSTRNANMWAPELHRIDDTWYMFYSSCDSSLPCCDSCSTRVLRGCADPGPFDCKFEHLADLIPPEGQRGGLDNNFAFSIDGTFLEVPQYGRYHVLSIRDNEFNQAIAITSLDTEKWTVGAWHVISIPDQPWERNITGAASPPQDDLIGVNEAPHPLVHGDDLWLCYSGSNCGTPNYSLGLLHWNGGDPLLASSWDKTGPVFAQANGLYGTAHNSFFTSPDGTEIWNAFHATTRSTGSCGGDRFTSAHIVTFDENNVPHFGEPRPIGEIQVPPSGEKGGSCRRDRH